MLGEKIASESGTVTTRRVLNVDAAPTVEISFSAGGSLLGVRHQTMGTYVSKVRPDGSVYAEGQGVVMGAGGEMATWKGSGVGTFKADGGTSFRGAIYYQTAASSWARLNTIAAVFEYEENADGSTHANTWEWR